jgi:hypothetical protein
MKLRSKKYAIFIIMVLAFEPSTMVLLYANNYNEINSRELKVSTSVNGSKDYFDSLFGLRLAPGYIYSTDSNEYRDFYLTTGLVISPFKTKFDYVFTELDFMFEQFEYQDPNLLVGGSLFFNANRFFDFIIPPYIGASYIQNSIYPMENRYLGYSIIVSTSGKMQGGSFGIPFPHQIDLLRFSHYFSLEENQHLVRLELVSFTIYF